MYQALMRSNEEIIYSELLFAEKENSDLNEKASEYLTIN